MRIVIISLTFFCIEMSMSWITNIFWLFKTRDCFAILMALYYRRLILNNFELKTTRKETQWQNFFTQLIHIFEGFLFFSYNFILDDMFILERGRWGGLEEWYADYQLPWKLPTIFFLNCLCQNFLSQPQFPSHTHSLGLKFLLLLALADKGILNSVYEGTKEVTWLAWSHFFGRIAL